MVASSSAWAQQYARPDGTTAGGGFSVVGGPATHHEALDETTADTADYIDSGAANPTTARLSLSSVDDPGVGTGHVLRFNCKVEGTKGPETCDVALYDGGTLIRSVSQQPTARGAWETFSFDLLEAEANAISTGGYADLTVDLTAGISNKGSDGDSAQFSWVELEVPASAGGPPTLGSSTLDALANVTSSEATLGGQITNTGGGNITERGIVWNTTTPPEAGGTTVQIPGTDLNPFSQSISGLTDNGKLFYFRSYAINDNPDTGYGPINSFYTEPNSSPGSVTVDNVGDVSFRINWPANLAGDGDGAIVVVSTNSITATPTDGVEHAFNSVYATGGTDIGTSEFVVYRGTGANSVTVTGLTDTTTYNIAVFYSSGSGTGETGINYLETSTTTSQLTNTTSVSWAAT
jgi:hypothetical protein